MYCLRCKMVVQSVLDANGINYSSIELGRVKLTEALNPEQKQNLIKGLKHYELELIEERSQVLIERIKTEIINILNSEEPLQLKLSVHLSQMLEYNYTYLANSFTEAEGITLEKFFIAQRVERVKELLVYENLSLTEITDELNYSSVSHLCLQFKKVSGMTPAEFKKKCQSENFVWRPI